MNIVAVIVVIGGRFILNCKIIFISATGHTLGSVFYTYTYVSQSRHLCKPTKKCSVCGTNVGFGNNYYESHTWETTGYGKEVCKYCSGTKV